jgi:hypothetical protein
MVDQHSVLRVKLSDIVEGLEFQSDERFSYLNTTNGEAVSVTTEELRAAEEGQPLEDFLEWQHDALRIALGLCSTPVDASISWGVSSMMRAPHPWIRWDSIWCSSTSLTRDVPTPKASIVRGSQRSVLPRSNVSHSPQA